MALQNIEANITLDLYNHDTTPSTVKAIQLDSQTRYVAAMLQNGGVQYDVDSGATVQLIVVRPDKVGVQITGETFTYGDEGAQFLGPYAELTQVALAVNGKMRGQFKITSGDQILRTEIFAISNGEALDASTDEWADEYDGYNLEEMATSIETNTADIASLEADVSQIKEDLQDMNTATDSDVGKYLRATAVENGKVTGWRFSTPSGGGGQDGFSPIVAVTDITGGHRITITDVGGEHSADVMDGTGSVDDVQINGTSVVEEGVANVPIGANDKYGVFKLHSTSGLQVTSDGTLKTLYADSALIKAGNNNTRPVVPSVQNVSTFYGLAKAAGDTTQSQSSNAVGNYTEDAKSAISEMLGGSVSVSGTTPTIVAKSGIRYVCGEVATLDFTPSATGICDVVFTSGSTPTVVTLPNTVKFPDGVFTAEADTTYEINILDGIYGAVMAWT